MQSSIINGVFPQVFVGDTRFELVTSTLSRFYLSVASSYFIRKLNEMGVLSFAFRVKRSYFSLFWERFGNAFPLAVLLVPDNDYTQQNDNTSEGGSNVTPLCYILFMAEKNYSEYKINLGTH